MADFVFDSGVPIPPPEPEDGPRLSVDDAVSILIEALYQEKERTGVGKPHLIASADADDGTKVCVAFGYDEDAEALEAGVAGLLGKDVDKGEV